MIKIENTVVPHGEQWKSLILGARNAMNSWDRSDSEFVQVCGDFEWEYHIGNNDLDLMTRLSKTGTDHRKFMRMIVVYADITAPLYWWKEYDTYKVGTVANSCSTMHRIHEKEFTLDNFSHEHLDVKTIEVLRNTIKVLNDYRNLYVNYNSDDFEINGCPSKKDFWWQMIQLLPQSYNQKRTVMLNYEVLKNMYHSRKNHKLDEWHTFCDWIEKLPYAKELICNE